MDRLSPVGLRGEEEHHASAKEVQGATLPRCWFACAAGSPCPLVGLGGGGGRLGGRGEHQATRLQFAPLSPVHSFWIFSATTTGFSFRIFSAASAL